MNLFAIFLTGLTSGGVSCASVQGGLLASVIANQEKGEIENKLKREKKNKKFSLEKKDFLPVGSFLLAKLFSHTILGFFLGFLGAKIQVSLEVQVAMQVFAALFMLATAANFLEIHPIFRHLSFQSPRFMRKIIRNTSKSNLLFAPAMLGLLSIFIPCGVTQSMEVLAISSGSAFQGAAIMFAFVLGTFPIFAFLGLLTVKLSQKWQSVFNKGAAIILISLAIYSLNASLVALDSPWSITKLTQQISTEQSGEDDQNVITADGMQKIIIHIENNGYSPTRFKVKKDLPVELTLESGEVYSCAQSFVMRAFSISTLVSSGQKRSFIFTPKEKGLYSYSCSMGMYTGVMEVV